MIIFYCNLSCVIVALYELLTRKEAKKTQRRNSVFGEKHHFDQRHVNVIVSLV